MSLGTDTEMADIDEKRDTDGVPVLPLDVVQQVIELLDPKDDRPELFNTLSVSRFCGDTARRMIFRDFTLGDKELEEITAKGLGSDGRLLPEVRAAFGLIENLLLLCPLSYATIDFLLEEAAVTPNRPLFPSVRNLTLSDRPTGYDIGVHRYPPARKRNIPPGAVVFDRPNVCMSGFTYRQLWCLPANEMRNITAHRMAPRNKLDEWLEGPDMKDPLETDIPREARWSSFRFFHGWSSMDYGPPVWEEQLRNLGLPPIQLCGRTYEHKQADQVREDIRKLNGWTETPESKIQLQLYSVQDVKEGLRPPPCCICGEDWLRIDMYAVLPGGKSRGPFLW